MNLILSAYKKGYRITELGSILNPAGVEINGYIKDGYNEFGIRTNTGNIRKVFVHRLQAFQKYGESVFATGVVVRHKNGVSTDNSYDNILIGTQSENMKDIPESVRISRAIHASSFVKKYNHEEIIKFHEKANSYKKTMTEFGITSKGTLYFILKKSTS